MRGLESRVALVTGGARGIGKIIAETLEAQGAAVATCDRLTGDRGDNISADLSTVSGAEFAVDECVSRYGTIDILVNNAAIDPSLHFLDVTPELWDEVVFTNVRGPFFCAQRAARVMARKRRGRIVNISSVHACQSMPGFSVYAASKGAINSLTRQLALDLSHLGITVNAIAPGAIEVEKFVADPAYDRAALDTEIPMGRVGLPQDVANLTAFLASDAAGWITGEVFTVDGGTSARLYLYANRPIPGQETEPRS
jgi:NAD(P)-dependent dehydrogenase (short-subunit alcohol dehydrogenase family)